MARWLDQMGRRVREADLQGNRVVEAHNPVETMFLGGLPWELAEGIAFYVGAALVYDGGDMQAIGSRSSLGLCRWAVDQARALPRSFKAQTTALSIQVELTIDYHPRMDETYILGRAKRVRLVKVLHKVAELYPELRVWDAPCPPEVTLRAVPPYRLGGVALPMDGPL